MSELPDNVVSILMPQASVGSHRAVEATQLSREKPFIPVFGVKIDKKYAGKVVTVDASSGTGATADIYLGDIPFKDGTTHNPLLSENELIIAQTWMDQKRENPWRFLTCENGIEEYTETINETLGQPEYQNIRSKKAREYVLFNAAIPEAIRQPYAVIPVDTIESMEQTIKPILTRVFKNGNHATIRTGHLPAIDGGGPWALIRNKEDFKRFLHDGSYSIFGSFENFLSNPDLKEILVGEIPQGKMEDDPNIQHHYGAWTLSCPDNGNVVLQVHPHDAHLRGFEEVEKDNIVTFTAHFDPTSATQLSNVHIDIGENLTDDSVALTLAEVVRETVLEHWWTDHQLPQRMAAITSVLDYNINPVFEGQARDDGLCLAYGMKTE